jgi:pimeloyl-ACP methyl ester carboxylesterase
VRSVILLAPYPTTHNVLVDGGETLDLSLHRLGAACEDDPKCNKEYPTLAATIEKLPTRFADDQGWAQFTAGLRMMLFFPLQTSRVPRLVDSIERSGRLPEPIAPPRDDQQASLLSGWISQGAFMSLLCAEDASRASIEEVRARAAGTFLGPGWAESLVRSCEVWPRKPLPADFSEPVAADVPALLLVGGLDPAVQPSWAHEIAATLPRARVVEVPEGQHSFIGMSGVACILQLMNEFIATDSAEHLDSSCAAEMRRPAFLPPLR